MCDFISWIEVEKDGNKILLYLTDEEVFSPTGEERLKECRHNDVIGHGAIREYFGEFFGSGVRAREYELKDFWNAEKLPKEIADKIKDFDSHWGRMFESGAFQNDDLRYIIRYAPDRWKGEAAKQLLKQEPDNYDLRYIINHAPDRWGKKAKKLLK